MAPLVLAALPVERTLRKLANGQVREGPRVVAGWEDALAVLYSNAFNNHLKFVNAWHRGGLRNTLPDVALIDVKNGNTRLKFFSGDYQSSIVFSPDGKFIYCAGFGAASPTRGWVVRKFSASNGELVRKFKKMSLKLRGNLAVSPDGRYLVAERTQRNGPWASFSMTLTAMTGDSAL